MKIEFSSCDVATLWVEVEGAMTWFGRVQYRRIDGIVECKTIFIDQCVSNVNLAKKHLCVPLSCLHPSKEATGNTERCVVCTRGESRRYRILRVLSRHMKNGQAAS